MQIGLYTAPENVPPTTDGLGFVESTVADLLCPADDEAVFSKRLAAAEACPVPVEAVNCLIPSAMKCTGPDIDPDALDTYMQVVCRRAARAGVRRIVFGSGGSRRVPGGFSPDIAADQLVGHLKRWGPIAARADVTVCLEPLSASSCNIVTTVAEGADLVRRADHPNIRLLADTYHMGTDGDPAAAIERAEGLIAHVHVAEVDGRGPLGTTGEDQRPYFRALKDIGYDQRVSIEASWTDLAAQLPAALTELREQIETA